jgi:outer membrane protein assembly factor BamD (BamD/ComL family)
MGKGLIILIVVLFIFCGLYGAYYYAKIQDAETLINESIMRIREAKFQEAVDGLKEILGQYNFRTVQAPVLFLLADTYEKMEKYENALETHKMLLSNTRLSRIGNWHIRSLISVSKLYRNGHIDRSKRRTESLEDYLELMIDIVREEKIRLKQTGIERFSSELQDYFHRLLVLNYDLSIREVSRAALLNELETELGFLYLQNEKFEKAEEIFLRIRTPSCMFGLAQLYLKTGRELKAIVLLEKLIEYDTSGKIKKLYIKSSYEYAQTLFEENRNTTAIALLKKIIEMSPDSEHEEQSLYLLARHYYKNRSFELSLHYIEEICSNAVFSRDEEAQLLKGYIHYDSRNYVKALKAFHEFIETYPQSEKISTAHEWKAMCERSIKYLG